MQLCPSLTIARFSAICFPCSIKKKKKKKSTAKFIMSAKQVKEEVVLLHLQHLQAPSPFIAGPADASMCYWPPWAS